MPLTTSRFLRPVALAASAALLGGGLFVPTSVAASPSTSLEPAAAVAQKDKKKAPKGVHRNTRFGFEFKKPKKWSNIAIKTSEEWLAAKYVSDSEYTYTDPDLGYTSNHAPEIQVIVFPLEIMKKADTEVDESEEDGEKKITITFNNPYRDYDDFLSRTFSGGGYYESEDPVKTEINGVKVTKLTYAVDKLARTGPQTISTWIYHSEDVDYAVQMIGLTKHWKKIQKSFKPVRQSFKLIERDGPIKHSGATSGQITITRLDLSEGTPKERQSKAVSSEKVMHEKAIAKLPAEGWKHKKDKRVLVLSSADKTYTNRVQKHTNNVLDWMDKEFGYLAEGSFLRAPIVRVCKNIDEAAAYTAGVESGGYGGSWQISDELVTWWDTSGWTGRAIDRLNDQICRYWMLEKNFALSSAMPEWIDNGIRELITTARMDSRKPEWRRDQWNISQFKESVRGKRAGKPREMFLLTTKEYRDVDNYEAMADRWAEGALLINYLASPDIRRSRQSKGLLQKYLTNMMTVVEEVEKESESALKRARKKLKGEDGEKDYLEARREIFQRSEKDILQRTFDLTFVGWSDDDWEDFTKDFYGAF